MSTTNAKTFVCAIFSSIAMLAGLIAFVTAGLKGHAAGWEEMLVYTGPAVAGALIAIVARRSKLSYLAIGGAALALLGLILGA